MEESKQFNFRASRSRGQSLIELLLAVAVGVILVGVAVAVIAPALKINTKTNEAKIGAALGRELLENLKVFSESGWHNLSSLPTGDTNIFHLIRSGDFFATSTGFEEIVVGTTTYSRFFYLEGVCRSATSENIFEDDLPPCEPGAKEDPSSLKATVVFTWPLSSTNTFATYFTRHKVKIFWQTDWSGGDGEWGPVSSTVSGFVTSTNIDFASTTGAVKLFNID